MKTKIFLVRDNNVLDADFLATIAKVCELNGVDAKVFSAVKIEGSKNTEVYGATVKAGAWDLLKLAEPLKNATGTDTLILPIVLDNMPKGFVKAKYATQKILGTTSGAKARVLGIAWDLHGALQKQWKEYKVNDSLIIDADIENNLLAITSCSYPDPNPDAWQKRLSSLMKKAGDEFNLAFSSVIAGEK